MPRKGTAGYQKQVSELKRPYRNTTGWSARQRNLPPEWLALHEARIERETARVQAELAHLRSAGEEE